jgi:hypothetical protein
MRPRACARSARRSARWPWRSGPSCSGVARARAERSRRLSAGRPSSRRDRVGRAQIAQRALGAGAFVDDALTGARDVIAGGLGRAPAELHRHHDALVIADRLLLGLLVAAEAAELPVERAHRARIAEPRGLGAELRRVAIEEREHDLGGAGLEVALVLRDLRLEVADRREAVGRQRSLELARQGVALRGVAEELAAVADRVRRVGDLEAVRLAVALIQAIDARQTRELDLGRGTSLGVAGAAGARRALHRRAGHRGSARWGQQVRGRLARDHAIRDRVGVALVGIAVGADAARQVDAGALLHDVGGLVRRGVQVGRRREGHVSASRVGGRADRRGGGGGGASDVGAHRRQLVGRTE